MPQRSSASSIADLVNVLSPQLVLISGEGHPGLGAHGGAVRAESPLTSLPLRSVTLEIDPWDDAKWAVGSRSTRAASDLHSTRR